MPDELVKAFSRGGGGAHKYKRRQRIFVGGKLRWRYIYDDVAHRERVRQHHDPHDEHEHTVESELKDIHENLKGKALTALAATVDYLKGLFGFGGKAHQVKVSATSGWNTNLHEPSVAAEAGGEGKRSPQARVAKGIELIPDHIKELIGESHESDSARFGSGTPGLKKVVLIDIAEDETGTAAGWWRGTTGELHITSLAAKNAPVGEARFGSRLTWTEHVVTHEVGHAVHDAIIATRPGVWDGWETLSRTNSDRISAYAGTNTHEDWAESFACALIYPKQLAMECPARYEFMRDNVLPELEPIDEIINTPDADLAWWVDKPSTPATKVLNRAQTTFPSQKFAPYYSDKDQFYIINKDGRQLIMRIGPPDKQSEPGWDRIPATIDPKTGLPRYEGGIYNRFRAAESGVIKEIYDENGTALDDKQAYLYLGQDDEKVIKWAEALDEDPQLAAEKLYGSKSKAAQEGSLGRQMFNSLGGNLFQVPKNLKHLSEKELATNAKHRARIAGTNEYERRRVEKARAKGATGELDRHQWVPVEISSREFMEKSGTFKFGEVRSAPDDKQTSKLRDAESGKIVMRYDPVAGKDVPVLSSRLYEQQNPDGTWTKIRVNESAPFSNQPGENSIRLPMKRVRVETNPDAEGQERFTTFSEEQWAKVKDKYKGMSQQSYIAWMATTLGEGDSTDPEEIARAHDTTARTLLNMNGKSARGQLSDPVLAALLNPGARKQIRCEADLQGLMREAAESDPPRRAWVSITGKSAHGAHGMAIAHIQVEWDGAGPPKVVGDYWAAKLGKSSVRLDELLDSKDQIKLPKITESRTAGKKREKVVAGGIVWVSDPKSGKRIMATYLRPREGEGGKVRHEVQPLAGQGAGIEKKLMVVDAVRGRLAREIPNVGKLGKERRFLKPLPNDVLLYADEVSATEGPNSTSGVIRIKLPADGSISHDQLRGMPGVQVDIKADADQLVAPIGISVKDLPAFRDAIGGFVMDSRVRNMLDVSMQQERQLREKHDSTEVVSTEDIADEQGNVAPDGVLKGLITGDEGIQPGEHRIKALKKLAKNGGRLLAAHFMGTGKTALAIMASQMMRNLRDENGNAHPNQVKGKTLILVPLNTAENWYQEFKKFAGAPPTLVGAGTLAGAQQLPKLPKRNSSEDDATYKKRVMADWEQQLKTNPGLWNPRADGNPNVVCPFEYFRDNEEALRITGLFDAMVVDEAHKIARENEVSRAVERWNGNMKMFLLMTGTPITNTLTTLPRIMRLVSNGQVDLGDDDTFRDTYLNESAVLKAAGAKNPPKTDVNPNMVGKLMAYVQPYMDVANTTDVKGQNMPAVLLDENTPAHMQGVQATMYRAAMARLTDSDRASLEGTAALGLDETTMLTDEARRKVAVARSLANAPSYKAPDLREELQYEADIATVDEKRKTVTVVKQSRSFRLPDYKMVMDKKNGWGGRWPSGAHVTRGMHIGYLQALQEYAAHLFGVDYASLEGKKIDPDILAAIKKGTHVTDTGLAWAGKIVNPDYGPEGMISRGKLNTATGKLEPLTYQWTDDHGDTHEGEVPVGEVFVRDPNRKAAGLFYHKDDWDFTGRFDDTAEGDDSGEGGVVERLKAEGWENHPDDKKLIYNPETGESKPKPKGWAGAGARNQGPVKGRENLSVQRSPARRQQRAMFDQVVTHGNAKCDALEEWIKNVLAQGTGDPNADLTQFILFGNRVGSSVRTMESKLRTMGFQDVNEALGNTGISGPADKALKPRKYFVTYMGKGATLGDRNINSEIFRRKQDKYGKDTGVSMFVHRTLYGGTKRPPKGGEIAEGWSANERKVIMENFQNGTGQTKKDGSPMGMEVPLRCMGVEVDIDTVVTHYVYESDLKGSDKKEIKRLEQLIRSSDGGVKRGHESALRALLEPHWTARKPMSDDQQHVFNNTQFMVASDAANVGLNWPAGYLGMYDSLFSPMDEWQRITRAARMLPPAVSKEAAPIVEKIDAWIREHEVNAMKGIKDYDQQTAIAVIQDAMDVLDAGDKQKLAKMAEGSPEMLVEAYFAKRSLERIQGLRDDATTKLRSEGYWPDPERRDFLRSRIDDARRSGDVAEAERIKLELQGLFVKPEAIQGSDITNYIIRENLSPFERKMMKDRRFLVDVKRFTTSVDMPEMVTITVEDPMTGKKVKKEVHTGAFIVESPVQAERAVLAQGRAKMVPYEQFLNDVQNATPESTNYDFVGASVGSMSTTSTTDKDTATAIYDPNDDSVHFDSELQKSAALNPLLIFRPPTRHVYYVDIAKLGGKG